MAYKVIVDAGHGGADLGATYQGRQEKMTISDWLLLLEKFYPKTVWM